MPAIMTLDQVGLPAGLAGFARTDGLDTGALVTVESVGGGTTSLVNLLWVPPSDTTAVASLVQTGPTTWEFLPTAGVYGSYRIELVTDEGLPTESRQIKIFGIRTPTKLLLIPAANEIADNEATLLNNTLATVDASEQNEATTEFPAGSSWGWWVALAAVIEAVEAGGGGGSTLDAVMTGGVPDNDVTMVDALRLRSAAGPMLELDEALDDVTISGRQIQISGGRGGTSSIGLSTQSQVGATNPGSIIAVAGDAVDGDGGQCELTAGNATGTGNGGQVTISGGDCDDPARQPGPVAITAGVNNGTSVRAAVTLSGVRTEIDSESATSGARTYRRGVRLFGASNVDIMSGNGDPNGLVTGLRGSLFLDFTNGFLWQNDSGALVWSRLSSSSLLWQWNGVNTSQFLPAVDLGLGAAIAGLTLTTAAGGPNGSLLRLQSTELADGGVMFPIDFSFPRRYVVEIVYREFAFTDVTNQGRNLVGLVPIADASCANIQVFGHLNITTVLDQQYIADLALSSGTPFGPGIVFNGTSASQWCTGFGGSQTGLTVRAEINTARPCAAQPEISVMRETSGFSTSPPTNMVTRANGNSFQATAYPGAWNGITLDTIGLMLGSQGGATTGYDVYIESLRVFRHPGDL